MNKIFLACAVIIFSLQSFAQECGNCDNKPTISIYDMDVQITQPRIEGGDSTAWNQWYKLYYLLGFVKDELSKAENCAYVIYGVDGVEVKLPEKVLNLPAETFEYGYLITSFVKPSGNNLLLHVMLQTSCNRKTIAEAEVVFQPSADESYLQGIVRQVVQKLMPLAEKIRQFEITERNGTNDYALRGKVGETIIIKPVKKILKAGETTDISLELNDCDGVPLAGREISFGSKAMWYGGSIEGTIGGIITPASVITDAQGRAKAIFKLTAPTGKHAIIKAHSVTRSHINCSDAFTGSVKIDALPAYRVTVVYQTNVSEYLNMNSNEDGVVMKGGYQQKSASGYMFALLHYLSAAPKDGEQIMMMPQFENNPEFQKSKSGKTIVLYNWGYSETSMTGKPLELVQSPFGAPPSQGKAAEQSYYSILPLPPAVSLLFKNNELIFFSASVEFPEPEEGLSPVSGIFSLNDKDKNFPVKARKINDPNSPYKWVYEFEYHKEDGYSKDGKVFKGGRKEMEGARVQIWKTF